MLVCDRCGNLASELIQADGKYLTPAMLGWSTQRVCVRNGKTTVPVFLCLRCCHTIPSESVFLSMAPARRETVSNGDRTDVG